MSTFSTTFAAVAEDQYRRQRAAAGFRAVGGAHHAPLTSWRERRRAARTPRR